MASKAAAVSCRVSAPVGLTSLVRSTQDEGRPAHSASVSVMTCLPTIARCSSTIAPDQFLELSSIPAKRFTNTRRVPAASRSGQKAKSAFDTR